MLIWQPPQHVWSRLLHVLAAPAAAAIAFPCLAKLCLNKRLLLGNWEKALFMNVGHKWLLWKP
jgi:hypothetical protein